MTTTMACQHLTLAHDPTGNPGEIETLTAMMRSSCRRTGLAEGGIGIADEERTRFWPESDAELAARQEREDRSSVEEGRTPQMLFRLHFASCDAEIVWPDPTPDGAPVLVAEGWHDMPGRGLVVVVTNPATHGPDGWIGQRAWIDGVRYRITGAPPAPDVMDWPEGKGEPVALFVETDPLP